MSGRAKDRYARRRQRFRARVAAAVSAADRLAEAVDYVRMGLARVRNPARAEALVGPAVELLLDVGDQLACDGSPQQTSR